MSIASDIAVIVLLNFYLYREDKSLQCNQLRRQDSAPLLLPGRAADATCLVQGNNHAELIAVLLGKHNKLPGSTASKLTLHDVLQDPKCCGIFKESLDREGTSQTLLFLMEVEEYRRIPMADYMSRTARKIYNKFIHPQCIMPIPITRLTRDTITVDIEGSSYTQSMFTPAFSEVCQYLEAHQFARFVASVDLMRVIDILKQEAVMEPEQRKLVRRGSIQLSPIVCSSITTFRDIIGSQACTRFFKEYCCRMYCSENLYFWMDAENYCNVPGNDYRRSIAVRIFRKFISSEAKQQINISSQLVATIFDGLQEAGKLLFKQVNCICFYAKMC